MLRILVSDLERDFADGFTLVKQSFFCKVYHFFVDIFKCCFPGFFLEGHQNSLQTDLIHWRNTRQ